MSSNTIYTHSVHKYDNGLVPRHLTNEVVDGRLLASKRKISRIGDVVNATNKIEWHCGACNKTWSATPNSVCRGSGCYHCSGQTKHSNEYVDEMIKKQNLIRTSDYINFDTPICWCCTKCSHEWTAAPNSIILQKTECPKCSMVKSGKKKSAGHYERVMLTFKEKQLMLISQYTRIIDSHIVRCLVCKYEWSARMNDIMNKDTGCPYCADRSYSKVSIKWLNSVMLVHNINIQHAENGGEFLIPYTKWKADGYCESTNTVYEFYGDIWHGNPNRYSSEVQCNPFTTKTAGELYTATMIREETIKQLGYNVVTMWET